MTENKVMAMAEPQQKGLAMLPAIALVNKDGSVYPVTNPGTVPEDWSWALPALRKLDRELEPTGNKAIDALKDKLVRIFSQNLGQIVLTEGPSRHLLLYRLREYFDPPGLGSAFRRAVAKTAAWVSEKAGKGLLAGLFAKTVACFYPIYPNGKQPLFQIVCGTAAYVGMQDLVQTQLIRPRPPKHNGIVNIRLASPFMHELTHAAVEAGHLLSGMENLSNTKSYMEKRASRNRIVNTDVFSLLESMDLASLNSIPAVVNTLPYREWEKPEEKLAHAVANYCGEAGQTPSLFLDMFIAEIFSRDLDFILAGDRKGRQALLDALKGNSSLFRNITHWLTEASAKQAEPKTLQGEKAETISSAMADFDNASFGVTGAEAGTALRQSAAFPASPA